MTMSYAQAPGYGPPMVLDDPTADPSTYNYARQRQQQQLELQQAQDQAEQLLMQAQQQLDADYQSKELQTEQYLAQLQAEYETARQQNVQLNLRLTQPNVYAAANPVQQQGLPGPPSVVGRGPSPVRAFAEGGRMTNLPRYQQGGSAPGTVRPRGTHFEVWDGFRWIGNFTTEREATDYGDEIAGQYRTALQGQVDPNGQLIPPASPPAGPGPNPDGTRSLVTGRDPRGNPMLPAARVEARPDSPHLGQGFVPPSIPYNPAPAFRPGVDPYPTDRPLTNEEAAAILAQLQQSGAFEEAGRQRALPPATPASSFLPPGPSIAEPASAGPSQEMIDAWAARERERKEREREDRQRFGFEGARASGALAREPGGWRAFAEGGVQDREFPIDEFYQRSAPPPRPEYKPPAPWEREPFPMTAFGYRPPTPAGFQGFAGGGMQQPNAITGEGRAKGVGYRAEIVIGPVDEDGRAQVWHTEGPRASYLPPGAIISPVPANARMEQIARTLPLLPGREAKKTKKGFKLGGRAV